MAFIDKYRHGGYNGVYKGGLSMKYPKADLEKREDRGGVYYFRYYHPVIKDGKKAYSRPNVSTGLKDKAGALAYSSQYIKDAIDGKVMEPTFVMTVPAIVEDAGPTLFERCKKFLERQYADSAKTTVTSAKRFLNYMILYSPTKLRNELTAEAATDIYYKFKNTPTRLGRLPEPRSCYYFLTVVREYWEWERAMGYDKNPFKGPHIQMPQEKSFKVCDEVWTPEECMAIYHSLDLEDKDAFWFMRWTGMYPKDTFMLRKEHVIMVDGGLGIMKKREKTKELISLPIWEACPEIADLLFTRYNALPEQNGRLFCRQYQDNKHVLFVDQFGDRVRAAWEREYPGTRPKMVKSLRHTRTTEWIVKKVEPDVIGNWLGHVDGSKMVLTIYSHRKKLMSFKKPS